MLSDQIKFPQDEHPWKRDAACNQADPNLFHAPDMESVSARNRREAQAKAICATCPVLNECSEWAKDEDDGFAILAGLTAQERGYTPLGNSVGTRRSAAA